ncbi:hypothetical protein CPLU01_14441 [Colletotrichum plurivorum]|uniref:Uncharacterized protein n=1 Tax=Colletotrichum plurivorum TaxID=2175906 RepID=A0A8H6JJH3_9PEZI|nr:hypothetical protein CPLU01_14441 [Colletotrichum plurivorum]
MEPFRRREDLETPEAAAQARQAPARVILAVNRYSSTIRRGYCDAEGSQRSTRETWVPPRSETLIGGSPMSPAQGDAWREGTEWRHGLASAAQTNDDPASPKGTSGIRNCFPYVPAGTPMHYVHAGSVSCARPGNAQAVR